MDINANRRVILGGAIGAAGVLAACASASAQDVAAPGWRLAHRPRRVFRTIDLPREGTEAWFIVLLLEGDQETAPEVLGMRTTLFAGDRELRTERYAPEAVEAMAMRGFPAVAGVHRPLGVRLICRAPASLNVDRMRCVLETAAGAVSVDVPIGVYTQQTDLIFPFRGPGIVTQGGAGNGGHRNASGAFAIDAMALAPNYAVQTGEAFAVNTDLAGFGRALVAPGAGVIVQARGDRPDQPVPGEANPAYFAPEAPEGDNGNHVVIDHGNGEFSLVAHMMAGSLAVTQGQRVAQGDPIGRLGNSGASFAPHVHFQLQDGPDWRAASGLPCRFTNIARDRLERGEFFSAR